MLPSTVPGVLWPVCGGVFHTLPVPDSEVLGTPLVLVRTYLVSGRQLGSLMLVRGMVCLIHSGLQKMLPVSELLCPLFSTDYSCALQRDILLQGRLYLSENWICFYSNIFRWETLVKTQGLLPWTVPLAVAEQAASAFFPSLTSYSNQAFS